VSPPNVFVLAIDSLRADAVHGDQIETPNLDALARRGSTFDQCICTTTTTTPSFSSILTGCYPPKHGVRGLHGYRLSSSIRTMPEAFSAAGYNTYAEVTGPLLVETGVLRGFAEAHHRPAYRQPFFGWRDSVISSMRSYVEPWFMLLHIWEVHRPYRAPPDFKKRRDKAGYAAAVTATDDYLAPVFEGAGDDAIVVVTGDHGEDYAESAWDFQLVRAARKIRRTLRLSRWFKYLDNRLAGREIGHGFALYEHLVRVPLTISGPGVPQNLVSDQVRHIDLFPTLADLCDVEIPDGIDGRSLRPLMEGKSLSEQPAYIEAVGVKLEGDRIAGVRTPDWKLLRRGRAKPALYKLDGGQPADEKRNLYRRYPEVARRLESVLDEIASSPAVTESGMTSEEESVVEQHLRDLGYL
jgi:arylsulfatase A-like enzyme